MDVKQYDISAVITVYNKRDTLRLAVESLLKQSQSIKEICVIDDASTDGSQEIIQELAVRHKDIIKTFFLGHRGYAAVLNKGLEVTGGEFVVFLDADATLGDGWIEKLMPYFTDEKVAAASGLIKLANTHNLWAMIAGYNLEYRLSKIKNIYVDHITTCNIIYRRTIFEKIGIFDVNFYYGADNDLSYRTQEAGYKLVLSKDAFCLHFWPESFSGFLKQRFHGAVGRMRLTKKYPHRWKGDRVSRLRYFLGFPELGEIVFFLKRKKVLLGLSLPFFSLLRSFAWAAGIIYFYFSKYFKKNENQLY